jgi:cadmium resistance protein CadD (predicted permease)
MTTKKIIIIGFIGVIIIYVLFAFANVSFNPKEWVDCTTGLCALLMGLVAFSVLFAYIIDNSHKM